MRYPHLVVALLAMLMAGPAAFAQKKTPMDTLVVITLPQGEMVLRLFDEAPEHRANFLKIAADGTLEGTTFHRVIQGFMIQGGDINSKDDNPMNDGMGDIGYTLPAEFDAKRLHLRGALAGARMGDQVNPERRSSGTQFYVVLGRPSTDQELDMMEQRIQAATPYKSFRYTAGQRQAYKELGGTPFLDMQYTVFGQVIKGMDVAEAVAAVAKDGRDRPLQDVPMQVSLRPMPVAEIEATYGVSYSEE